MQESFSQTIVILTNSISFLGIGPLIVSWFKGNVPDVHFKTLEFDSV